MEKESVAAEPRPPAGWRAVVRITTGIGLILLGIVGLILPIMPGWIFLIPGLLMVGDYYPPVKRLVAWARMKFEDARAVGNGIWNGRSK